MCILVLLSISKKTANKINKNNLDHLISAAYTVVHFLFNCIIFGKHCTFQQEIK